MPLSARKPHHAPAGLTALPSASNVVRLRSSAPPGPLRFSARERAALLALTYRFEVEIDYGRDESDDDHACLVAHGGAWGVASIHPVREGGISVSDDRLDLLGTYWTPGALSAAIVAYLEALGFASGR